ncbi:hypothetical protein [Salinithrix halophila]|uniref:YjzC-like protein n=1 Tax=Salinithrix halophila TaxID=1485204 RepID=A0ABV8J9R1_9BACL
MAEQPDPTKQAVIILEDGTEYRPPNPPNIKPEPIRITGVSYDEYDGKNAAKIKAN